MLRFLPKESIVFDCAALISPAAAVRAAGVLMHCPQPRKIRQREELSRIASVKLKKAVTAAKQAVSPRVLAFCVMVVCLVATLGVTAANLRLTYVTDSHGARQVVLTSESDPARVMSLSGIEGDNPFLKMLKPESFSPIIALIGVIMIMTAKHNRTKDIGKIMVGFSVLMTGMTLMSGAVSPLADSPQFSHILTAFRNPIMGVLVGAVFTGVIQSSAASVGILQALSLTGQVTYGMAIPIIMGQNIGTCVTALLSSIGVNRSAKRVACVHICFNCIGTLVILPIFYGLYWLLDFAFVGSAIDPAGVALVHTIFNIVTTAMLLPFTKLLEKLAYTLVRDSKKEKEAKKNQKVVEVKETRLSLNIDTNDFNTKLKNGQKFLQGGDRLKVTIRFRGREMAHTNIGEQLLRDFAAKCADIANLDKQPKLEGRNMSMFLSPKPQNTNSKK